MNSGTGYNDGIYRVTFDDGLQICFITPGGEISGLTTGDRKFNLTGKCISIFIQPITGSLKQTLSLRWYSTHSKKACFHSENNKNLLTTSKVPYGRSNLNSWPSSSMENENNLKKKIDWRIMVKLVAFGTNMFFLMVMRCSRLIGSTQLFLSMRINLYLLMPIGEKISSIGEEIRSLVLKLKNKD